MSTYLPPYNFNITSTATVTKLFTFCALNTNTITVRSFPVFSKHTTGAGWLFAADSHLANVTQTMATSTRAYISSVLLPASINTNFTTETRLSVLFTQGLSYSSFTATTEEQGLPKRYVYVVHNGTTLSTGTTYSISTTYETNVLAYGVVRITAARTTAGNVNTICSVT
jgi:hypothetical protein